MFNKISFLTLFLILLPVSVYASANNYEAIGGFDYGANFEEIKRYKIEDENVTIVKIDIITVDEVVGRQLDLYHSDLVDNFGVIKPENEKLYKIYREKTDIVIGFIHEFFLVNLERLYMYRPIIGGRVHIDSLANVIKFIGIFGD